MEWSVERGVMASRLYDVPEPVEDGAATPLGGGG